MQIKELLDFNHLRNILKSVVYFLLPPVSRLRKKCDDLEKEIHSIEYNRHEILGLTNSILGEINPISPSDLIKSYKSVSESINNQLHCNIRCLSIKNQQRN